MYRVSSLGVPGVPWHPQILADQLTLSQSGVQIMANYYYGHYYSGFLGFRILKHRDFLVFPRFQDPSEQLIT